MCWVFLACATTAHAQPVPQLTASWQGRSAIVAWQGAPEGSCVYAEYQGIRARLEPCGSAQTVRLPVMGVDTAYVPRGTIPGRSGTRYVLHDERGQRDVASVELEAVTLILPLVVR